MSTDHVDEDTNMHRSIHDLGIDRLSVAERIALVQAIWDSVADAVQQMPPSSDELEELDRRLADDEQNPDDVVDWQTVRSAAASRWPKV